MEVIAMRVLLVAPPDVRVNADSSHLVAAPLGALADGLADAGHQVTLWAAPGSQTRARLRSITVPKSVAPAERDRYARLHTVAALSNTDEFDAVHLFGITAPAELLNMCTRPVSRTLMEGLPAPGERIIAQSWTQLIALAKQPDAHTLGVVYPGIDSDRCPFGDQKDGYLIFTGPLTRERGLEAALTAAYRAERPLYLVGPEPPRRGAWSELLAPFIERGTARCLGDLPAVARREVVSRASALLLPVVSPALDYAGVEALACGTPVVTVDSGVARELVVHGESGIIAHRPVDLAAAIDQVDLIAPRSCRRRAEHCFNAASMAEQYAALLGSTVGQPAWSSHPELAALDPK